MKERPAAETKAQEQQRPKPEDIITKSLVVLRLENLKNRL